MSERRRLFTASILCAAVTGCGAPGLPPVPPERDAANAAAPVPKPPPAPDLRRSAFVGVEPAKGHAHHHHGPGKPAAEAAPEGKAAR